MPETLRRAHGPEVPEHRRGRWDGGRLVASPGVELTDVTEFVRSWLWRFAPSVRTASTSTAVVAATSCSILHFRNGSTWIVIASTG